MYETWLGYRSCVLSQVTERFHWLCHAYCLMDNHYHLVVETPDANLSQGMRQLNGVYTQAYNRRHRRVGHLFQGRFKGILVQKESHFLEVCRYVVLNPVAAGIVKHPRQWAWSSYRATSGESGAPRCLTVEEVLGQFTKLVPPEKYPKSYWDLVRDPYWVDLIKRKRVGFTDPRIANIGVYHMYGLKEVNAKEYGEGFIREFAGLKPKLFGFNESGEVARGELHAMLGGPWRVEYSLGTVPITKLCLEPGCVSTQSPLFAVVKNAPHPNAAKVFVDFVLSREYAEWRVQALGNTPARADVTPRPLDDPAKHKLQYAGDDKAERQITEVLKWVIASKLFDY